MALNEVEVKLAQYRAKKQREAFLNKALFWGGPKTQQQETEPFLVVDEPELKPKKEDIPQFVEETNMALTSLDYIQYCLYFILWATIYGIFIKLQFGTVYLIISMLFGIYFNTGTRTKRPNEPSAYSVFNENCQSIPGTLDAEKMTQQMLYGFNT
ncbi:unnamed protein product [Ceutorhynchus assimilis]|uniref:SAYSvFN domain-containing protein n=1 Tax=Ceutorhynchus assimilis TaxID=467358 RepID=A0A9N9QGJ7_9CUCU|nr:unnamed protein product [Ceutorhynchus assimilis]